MRQISPVQPVLPFNLARIAGISLDLDDTLWPIQPTLDRAKTAVQQWLRGVAPLAAELALDPVLMRRLRAQARLEHAEQAHDMAVLRRETLRALLRYADEDTDLAEPAFEVFFAERQRVQLYPDVLPALRWLSERYPLVAISNGNADLQLTGVARWFRAGFNAKSVGSGKPHAPIFRAAAAAVGLLPNEMLHVGDDLVLDVEGAQHAGMQAAWLVRKAKAWEDDMPRPQLMVPNLAALCMVLDGNTAGSD